MPRIKTEPDEEKLVQGSVSDHLEDHCAEELMNAAEKMDARGFRSALEALVMDMFDWGDDASHQG